MVLAAVDPTGLLATVLVLTGFLILQLQLTRRGGRAFARARSTGSKIPGTRFSDVVGCDEVVEELREIVEFIHRPGRFAATGADIPRGFLLVGPPGTGKTLLARAVAGESGVPFYSVSGSDFAEMFVGVGAARVRSLFAKAKKTGGIVFVDEIDSVGKSRQGGLADGGSDEREATLNAVLVEMDGFRDGKGVIVLAATNRPDVLDPALLRPGRFDRMVTVPAPDRRGRTSLLEHYSRDKQLGEGVDFVDLARRTPGLTGAGIANLVNLAALEAARRHSAVIEPADFEEALATVVMGRARRDSGRSDRDRTITAWHEAGHAVAALVVPEAPDPVHVTIVPRGAAGGVTWMSGDDHSFLTGAEARAKLVVSMAGRAAEEHLLDGDFTQGAQADFVAARDLATKMVASWGMSRLGMVGLDPGRSAAGLSERLAAEVAALLEEALAEARAVVAANLPFLERVVEALLAEDALDGEELAALRRDLEMVETV